MKMINDELQIEFFAVRNNEGKYFRRKGYSGSGDSWVDDLGKARIYRKIGQARSIVSFFYNKWPAFGVPDIVKFVCVVMEVINEEDRVEKNKKKRGEYLLQQEINRKERELKNAQEELEKAKQKIKILKESQ